MLAIVRQEPALQALIHHRGCDREMKRGRASVVERLRVQLAFEGRRIFDDAESGSSREQAEVPRFLRRGRAMNEFGRVALNDPVGVADPELMLIDQQTIARRFAFEERDGSFDSPSPPDERSGQERDDAEMRDEKGKMMFAPDIEPRGAVNIRACHLRIEGRFVQGARNRPDDQHGEENDRQLERREKAEDRIALPAGAGSEGRCGHWGERAFSARSSTRSTREFASVP